jgi:hypothetical protein
MKNYVTYDYQTGEIQTFGLCQDQEFDILKQSYVYVIEGIGNPSTHYVLNDELISYTQEQINLKANQPSLFSKWSNETFQWIDSRTDEQKTLNAELVAKSKRNQLLMESDWTQLPDVPLTNKDQWATYRQQLRDITEQSGYPFNVIWPDLP